MLFVEEVIQSREGGADLNLGNADGSARKSGPSAKEDMVAVELKIWCEVWWMFPKIKATPKWMVYNGKPY